MTDTFSQDVNLLAPIDILCFAKIVYEMATGRRLRAAFPGKDEVLCLDKEVSEALCLIYKPLYDKTSPVPLITADEILKLSIFTGDVKAAFSNPSGLAFNLIRSEYNNPEDFLNNKLD